MATVKKSATKKSTKTTATKKPATIKPAAKKTAKKGGCKGLFIGITIVAVLAIAAAVVCYICFGKPNLVGSYKLTGIERDGEDQSQSITTLEELGLTATMNLNDDETGDLNLFGEKADVTYNDKEITIDGKAREYTYNDGKITFEQNGADLTFTKDE